MAKGRRWFRYSLRSLLVLMFLVAIFLAWFTPRLKRARREGAAVQVLQEANTSPVQSVVRVSYQYERAPFQSNRHQSLSPQWLNDALGGDVFASVYSVGWYWKAPPSEHFAQLRQFENLRELELFLPAAPVESIDAALAEASRLPHIERLRLTGSTDDATFVSLARMNELFELSINRAPFFTGRGPVPSNTISAQSVARLASLENLRYLDVGRLNIDDDMVAALGKFDPKTRISIDTALPMSVPEMVQVENKLPNCWLEPLQKLRDQFVDMARRPRQIGHLRVFGALYSTDDLLVLTRMRGISELCVDGIRVENASLDAFSTMPWLDTLVFWHADLDGVDLGRLDLTPRLRRIALVGPVKSDVIATLAGAKNVRKVLYQPCYTTQITGEDVEQALDTLGTLSHLEQVVLAGEMVDEEDAVHLQAALSDAIVSRSEINRLPDIRAAFVKREPE